MELAIGIMCKILMVVLISEIMKGTYNGPLRIPFAWLMSYFLMFCGMILLSIQHRLNGKYLIIFMLTVTVVLCIIYYKCRKENRVEIKLSGWGNIIATAIICCVFVALVLHNVIYYDTTDDALTQGMTKLAFMQQHQSMFVKYSTVTINIFSNEWIGELNGLFYLLITGKDNLVLLGNVEIYLFIIVVLYGVIKIFNYKGRENIILVGYFGTTPVILGLAMTLKTDLIALIMVVLMVATLLSYYRDESDFLLCTSIAIIGITAASKITVLPVAGLFAIGLIIYFFKRAKRKPIGSVVVGIGVALIFCTRYIANLIQYGNPVQRALNEKVTGSFGNLIENAKGIVRSFGQTEWMIKTSKPWSAGNWTVTKGIGYGGEVILVLILFLVVGAIIYRKKKTKKQRVMAGYFIIPYVGAFAFVLFGTVWYDWSFRYYYPYIMLVEIVAVIGVCNYLQKRGKKKLLTSLYALLGIMMCLNSIQAFRYGQAIPAAPQEMAKMSKTEKKLLYSSVPKYQDLSIVPGLMEILEQGGEALVLDEFSVPFYEFFGDDNGVYIDLVANEDELLKEYGNESYDFIAIASADYDAKQYKKAESCLKDAGYKKYVGSYGAVFITR